MMKKIGVRLSNNFYIFIAIDPDSGDNEVLIEIKDNEGNKIIVPGDIVFGEGEVIDEGEVI